MRVLLLIVIIIIIYCPPRGSVRVSTSFRGSDRARSTGGVSFRIFCNARNVQSIRFASTAGQK